MSEPIKKGDLVVIVRWPSCGCCLGSVGEVMDFLRIESGECDDCAQGASLDHSGNGARVRTSKGACRVPLEWLKRIPDFPELTDERHDEEITA